MEKQFWAAVAGGVALLSSGGPQAAVVEGTFTAVVTEASDPGQLSFGRDPASWVGMGVTGTFSYDVETPGVIDQNPAPDFWGYGDPARNVDWVVVEAVIDGVTFRGTPLTANTAGTVTSGVGIADNSFGGGDWYPVQHSYAIVGGRSVVGFDVFGPPTMFSYSGSGGAVDFDFGATPGAFGVGLIEDLYEPGGVVQRHGLIRFQLTSLTFGKSVESLIEDLLEAVTGEGPGGSLADKMAIVQAYVEAGDTESACQMLHAFANQVSAQSGKQLSVEEAGQLLDDASEIADELGCD